MAQVAYLKYFERGFFMLDTVNININPFLASGTTIPDIVQKYAQKLRGDHTSFRNTLHANKLEEYKEMISDSEFLEEIKSHFDAIYHMLKDESMLFSLDGRRKSLYSFENKVNLLLSQNRSLDLLRDIFAFRLITFDEDNPEKNMLNLYQSMEKIITYLTSQGFIPCESVVSETVNFNRTKYPQIFVPAKSLLNDEFKDYVKDYVLFPKPNGYQSLHASFRDSRTGRFFEVQIRTATMHQHAEGLNNEIKESMTADHSEYKEKKYSAVAQKWNLSEIKKLKGFYYIGKKRTLLSDTKYVEVYMDLIGLMDALVIFIRRHTF